MLVKIKNIIRHLDNPRSLGLAGFGVVAILVSWSGVKAIETNYKLQKQIAQLNQENDNQTLENDNLRLKNTYYDTNQYLELTARRVFGLAAPGETLMLVPKEVALKHTVDLPVAKDKVKAEPAPEKPVYQRHLEAWRDFFLHH